MKSKTLLAVAAAAGLTLTGWSDTALRTKHLVNTLDAVGFEQLAIGTYVGTGTNDVGVLSTATSHFLWSADDADTAENNSVVATNASPYLSTTTSTRSKEFDSDAANANFLNLSAEGGTLYRTINPIADATSIANVAPKTIDSSIWVDTLVQFTVNEEEPEIEDGAKFAMWLGVTTNSSALVTNLYVKASSAELDEDEGIKFLSAKTYKLAGDYVAGKWYRLKVRAVKSIVTTGSFYSKEIPVFTINIDNIDVAVADPSDDNPFGTGCSDDEDLIEGFKTLMDEGYVFPSLSGAVEVPTLTAVGFQGTGSIDDFVVSTVDPDKDAVYYAPVSFTFTWDEGIDSISYTINGGESVSVNMEGVTTRGITEFAAGNAAVAVTATLKANYAFKGNPTAPDVTALSWDVGTGVATFTLNEKDASITFTTEEQNKLPTDPNDTGAYLLSTKADFVMLADYVKRGKFDVAGAKINLGADIADFGAFTGIGVLSETKANRVPFTGTFDGKGHTISGLTFGNGAGEDGENKYCGFFNIVSNATIKNLTISWDGFDSSVATTYKGGAAFVGYAYGDSTLEALKATSSLSEVTGTHNMAGIALKADWATIKNCTNEIALTTTYSKAGGMTAFTQNSDEPGGLIIDGCVNTAGIVGTPYAKGSYNDDNGVGGMIGDLVNGSLAITNCANSGNVVSEIGETTKTNGYAGTLIGKIKSGCPFSAGGVNTAQATLPSVGYVPAAAADSLLAFATIADNVATFVEPEVNGSYSVMYSGAKYTFAENAADGATITLTPISGVSAPTVTSAAGKKITQTGNTYTVVYTYTLTVNDVDNATYEVYVGEELQTVPYTFDSGTQVTVKWTPAAHYSIDSGATEVITLTADTTAATVVPRAWLKYYATVYTNNVLTEMTAQLGTGDHYYDIGVTETATKAGVMTIGTDKYYVSKLVLKGTTDTEWTFTYDGATLTKATGTDDVTIGENNVLSYEVVTGTQNPFAEVYLTKIESYTITYLNADGTPFTEWASDYAAPQSYTIEDAITLPVADNVSLTTVGSSFQGWTNTTYTSASPLTGWTHGQMTGNIIVAAYITGGSVTPEPITPGEPAKYGTEDAAKAAASSATVAIPTTGSSEPAVTGDDVQSYQDLFVSQVTQTGENEWTVDMVLTQEGTNTVQEAASNAVVTVANDLATIAAAASEATTSVTIQSTAIQPGFYYSISAGDSLSSMAETGERKLAESGKSITLAVPNKGTKGFYKVLVNTTAE